MPVSAVSRGSKSLEPTRDDEGRIIIGLVNNMPDSAIRSTERQFLRLLSAAAGDLDVRLRFYSLPDVPRTEGARTAFMRSYADINELWDDQVDGLIVTGAEPRASTLMEEPYWGTLAGLIDWAADNTISTIYSCLAAHAAVLHIDGINRQALGNKLSGVFECVKASEHALVGATPQSWCVPHSRYNGLCENELISKGYHPVTCSQIAGLDSFVKQQGRSLFFFLQGHMEYGAEALLREYVRDITRYLKGERETYPCMPHSYFDRKTAEAFAKLREHALTGRDEQLLAKIAGTAAECKLLDPWRPVATSIYGNWLSYIAKQKSRTREAGHRRRRGLSAAM